MSKLLFNINYFDEGNRALLVLVINIHRCVKQQYGQTELLSNSRVRSLIV